MDALGSPELREWVEKVAGGRIVAERAHNQGFGRLITMLDVETSGGERRELVLRREAGTAFAGTEISLAREAVAYRALHGRGIPIARLYGVTDAGDALLMERVAGSADTAQLSAAQLDRLAVDFAEVLAALHAIDPEDLDLPGFRRPRTPEDHARQDLDLWNEMYEQFAREPDPLVRFSYQWLARNAPSSVQRTVLLQGDTGPGNLLHEDGRVRALIDWEFCHVGDPLEDLAWVAFRSGLQPFADLASFFRRYCSLSGVRFERERVLYYRVLILFRCVIGTIVGVARALEQGTVHQGLGINCFGLELMRRHLCELLAQQNGWPLDLPEPPEGEAGEGEALLNSLICDLNDFIVPAVSEPVALARAHGLAASLLHLRAAARHGRGLESQELEEMGALLGSRPASLAEGARGVDELIRRAGAERDAEIFRYLARRAARSAALWPSRAGPAPATLPPVPEL